MKKQNLNTLKLNKKSISSLSQKITGGAEISERRTNCRFCAVQKA